MSQANRLKCTASYPAFRRLPCHSSTRCRLTQLATTQTLCFKQLQHSYRAHTVEVMENWLEKTSALLPLAEPAVSLRHSGR